MFDFWYELATPARVIFSLVLIGASVAIFFLTGGHLITYGLGIIGLVMLLFSNAGNNGGYKF
jgi:hypothetical protein